MCHTAILGRRLDRPVINLGFSGNAMMEPEVGQLISEIDACMYVLDPVPNMRAEMIEERAAIFIGIIRAKHPETPIVMVEDRTYPAAVFIKSNRQANRTRRLAYSKVYDELKRKGDKNLYYIKGEDLFGTDNEATVDGSHPSDLGFMRMSDKLEPILRKALKKKWF
jgi:lysophospholipase L1-like esterase